MNIVRIDEDFQRWDELLALILSSFAYMNDRIDPPSSASTLTRATLADKARVEIAYVAMEGETLSGCVENHDVFARWGFEKTCENAHPGFTRTTSIEMRKAISA